jgi:uncharacterized protein
MNEDIEIMIKLQRYWDNVLGARENLERDKESISFWEKELKNKKQKLDTLEEEIKKLKIAANQKEVELSDREEHVKKLEVKKDAVKTAKESTAIEHEFEKAKADIETIEEDALVLLDTIEEKEKMFTSLQSELQSQEEQSVKDINGLKERINNSDKTLEENQNKFNELAEELSSNVKSRFLKLIKSQSGKGIAKLQGEICGACNFQIPFYLIQDVSRGDKVITCTNCGRYLYKENEN